MIQMDEGSLPDYVYTGKKWNMWDEKDKWYVEPMLLDLFRDINDELFDNKIVEPSFLVFSKFCFKKGIIRTFGTFQCNADWCYPGSESNYGIYISIEDYLIRGMESIKKILLHEMIHAYLWQIHKGYSDGDRDFIYYSGWYKSELYHKNLSYNPELEDTKETINLYQHEVIW